MTRWKSSTAVFESHHTSDLALKAALFPSCTLLVSGNYQFLSVITLYNNRIEGAGEIQAVRMLPRANDHDLTDCWNCDPIHSKNETAVPVTAIFSPADSFYGDALFESQGNTSFENIGFQKTVSEFQDPINLVSQQNPTDPRHSVFNVGLASRPNSAPVIDEWGRGERRKHCSRHQQTKKGEYAQGQNRRDKSSKDPSSSKKGPYTAAGGKPPRKPSRWDQRAPIAENDITVTMVLTLVAEILSGNDVERNVKSICDLLKDATPKTYQRLMQNEDFKSLNRRYNFIISYPTGSSSAVNTS